MSDNKVKATSWAAALMALSCTSCGHPVHPSFTDTPGCSYYGLSDGFCPCPRATICGDDILALIREYGQPLDLKHFTISSPEDLLTFHRFCAARGQELIGLKNHDYAGYSSQQGPVDVMKNFRAHEEYGIVVRLGDKLKRMENFALSGKLLVEDESIFDTAIDVLNYAILYLAYGYERRTRLLREVRSKVAVISAPAIVGEQYDTIVRMWHLLDERKIEQLHTAGHRDLASILDEIRSYQWDQGTPPKSKKINVVHDLTTRLYMRLDEDGCLRTTDDRYIIRNSQGLLAHQLSELPENCVVVAELYVNEHTSHIQFGVGNDPI